MVVSLSFPPSLSFWNLTLASESSNNLRFDDMGQFTVHQCASGGALPLSLALCLECLFLALAIENFYSNTKSSSGIPFSVMTFLISIPTPKSSPTVIYSLSFTLFACRNLTSYTYSTQFVAMLVTKNRKIKYYNILCVLQLLVITDK